MVRNRAPTSRGARRLAQGQQGVLPLFARPEEVTYNTWTPSPTNLKTIASRHTHTCTQIHTRERRDRRARSGTKFIKPINLHLHYLNE
ncbi:hypothetical protein TSAR_016337 [Trichomalopsis sarcophagae]|uniref:Uncharacterized protein n=1 Tax=Trichomalopsis sarcophagae TaxID=543379 RepID=A0A232EIG4_9HYME|nr:hypothetical protein TSAR_016337 [Trichomalopsis sarcophagae]